MKPHLIVMMFVGLLLWPVPTQAQQLISLNVEPAFDSFYKTNAWQPIQVTVANQGSNLQGALRVTDDLTGFNVPTTLHSYPVDLPSQSRKQLTLYTPLRGQNQLRVELVDEQERVVAAQVKRLQPLDETALLIGVIANDLSLLNRLSKYDKETEERVAVAHLEVANLPTMPQAWEGLDVLVFNDVDTSLLSPAQLAALSQWLAQGGQLILGGGPNATRTIAGLTSVIPLEKVRLETLPHPLSALEDFANQELPDRGPYVAAIPETFAGEVVLQQEGLPLIITQPNHLGQIYYLAFDLSLAPLDSLAEQEPFMNRLGLDFSPSAVDLIRYRNQEQLQTSLGVMSNQSLPEPLSIALYLFIYVIIIGPLNFVLLRLVNRSELAWLTMPLIICVCSSVVYVSGFSFRGGEAVMSQLNIIQATAGNTLAEVTAVVGVYSPSRANYQVRINQPALVEGLEDSIGLTNQLTVISEGDTRINNLRGDIRSMPGFMARSTTTAPGIQATLDYKPTNQQVTGHIINDSGQPLQNAALVLQTNQSNTYAPRFRILMINLDTLAAGQRKVINQVASERGDYTTFYPQAYESSDRELVSRDMVLRALMLGRQEYINEGTDQFPEWRAYLVGWQSTPPLEMELTSHTHQTNQQNLVIVNLPLEIQQ